MHHERWRLLEEHFHVALSLAEPQRASYLDRIRRSDPPLHGDLEQLIVASGAASRFLEHAAPLAPIAPNVGEAGGSLAPGVHVAHWRIVRLLGRGGSGEVYEVRRAGRGPSRAALKIASATPACARLTIEQRLLASVRHAAIPQLLEVGTAEGLPYVVMELVEGMTITAYCKMRRVGPRGRLALFLRLCETVAHLHRHSIAHGDLKPGNVLVNAEGRVRLVDFGSAAAACAAGERLRDVYLTPDYAAPEQLAGAAASAAADVHALGVVLYELLVGRRPWAGAGGLAFRVAHDAVIGAAPRASEAAARSPGEAPASARFLHGRLDSIIATCLSPDPERRYGSAAALAADVAAVLADAAGPVPYARRARSRVSPMHGPGGTRYRLLSRPRGRSAEPFDVRRRRAK